jgi:hypothetical protein
VVTVVADPFTPINWFDAVVPFVSSYRPIWLGLGALAFDLLLALVVTSLLRYRLGYKTWRFVHWFAYVCWPVAVLHGFGTGTDTASGAVFLLTTACVVAVLAAVSARLVTGLARRPGVRGVGLAAFALAPVLLVAWLWNGPLASGWARRAGTPVDVLARSTAATSSAAAPASSAGASPAPTGSHLAAGLRADLAGTVHTSAPDGNGVVVVSLVGSLTNGARGSVDVELTGRAVAGGGVRLATGAVTLTANGERATGRVSGVQGPEVIAALAMPDGSTAQLVVRYTQLDQPDGNLVGVVELRAGQSASSAGRGDDQ